MASQPSVDGVFASSRRLPFTPAQIYSAFAQADRLAAWWGPDGFTNTFVMHGPDGNSYPNECVFGEVSPNKIVIAHICAPFFTLTITLTPADGQTDLHWQQAFNDPKVAASLAHIIAPANEQNLNRLQIVLAAGAAV